MSREVAKITKHTIIYGAGMIISKAVSFIMLPVYTRYLSPEDYGVLELLTTTIDLTGILSTVGLTATIFKFYFRYEKPEDKQEIISTAMILMLVLSILPAIAGYVLSEQASEILFQEKKSYPLVQMSVVIFFSQQVALIIPFMLIRAEQKSVKFVLINLIKLIIQLSLNIYYVAVLGKGIWGVLYSTLLAYLIIGLYLLAYTIKKVGIRFSAVKSYEMLKFGYPFIFVSISSFVLTYSDRYFLNVFSDLKTVGIYALAYKFGFLMGYLAVAPFMLVWEPQRFVIAQQKNGRQVFKRIFLYYNIAVISLSFFISLFVKDMLTILAAPSYREASNIVPIILAAYVFQSWTFYCSLGIYLENRSKYMAIASLLSALLVTCLNYSLIPRYGAYGAAGAALVAFFARFVLVNKFSQKYFFIDYGWRKPVLLCTASGILYLFAQTLGSSHIPLSLAIKLLVYAVFLSIIYSFALDEEEQRIVLKFIKRPYLTVQMINRSGS